MLWIAEKQYLDRSRANSPSCGDQRRARDGQRSMKRLLGDNQKLLQRMHRSYLSTITSLARRRGEGPYTSGHTERVARIA